MQITLQAGEETKLTIPGHFLRCTSSTADFHVDIDNAKSSFTMGAGRGYTAPAHQPFTDVRIKNTSAAPNVIVFEYGLGELADNRLTVTGDLHVINAAGTDLSVVSGATPLNVQAAGGGALPVNNTLANALFGREKASEGGTARVLGASTYSGSPAAAGVTMVSAAANVNGVRVTNLVGFNCNGNAVMLKAGGIAFCSVTSYGGSNSNPSYDGPPIIVPAGLEVTIHHTASLAAQCFYDIL